MEIGYTGTQKGMTVYQKQRVRELLLEYNIMEPITAVHHGDCIGGDAEFHDIVREVLPNARILVHPPKNPKKRAYKGDVSKGDIILPEKDYHERNHCIVDQVDVLMAYPGEMEWRPYSGTWSTRTYAINKKKTVRTILPEEIKGDKSE